MKSHNFSMWPCLERNVPGCILMRPSWTLILSFLKVCTDNISLQLISPTGSLEYLKEFYLILKRHAMGSNFSWHMKKLALFLHCCEWCTTTLVQSWWNFDRLVPGIFWSDRWYMHATACSSSPWQMAAPFNAFSDVSSKMMDQREINSASSWHKSWSEKLMYNFSTTKRILWKVHFFIIKIHKSYVKM